MAQEQSKDRQRFGWQDCKLRGECENVGWRGYIGPLSHF